MATLKDRVSALTSTLIEKLNLLNNKKINKPNYDSGPDDKLLGVRNGNWEEITFPPAVSDAADVTYHNPTYTTVEQALDQLLYVLPAVSSFTNNAGSPILRGTTIQTVKFDWGVNKTIVSQSINQGVGAITPATARTKTITGQSITNNTTYRLTISDGQNTATRDTSITFENYKYWGNSPKTYDQLTPTDIQAFSKEIKDAKAKSFSFQNNGGYFYYLWRKTTGTITVKLGGLTFTDWIGGNGQVPIPEISITNSAGGTETYYILQTTNTQNGLMEIVIS